MPKAKATTLGLYLTAGQAYRKWKADPRNVRIIDVRTPEESFFVGYAPMAWRIPVARLTYVWDAEKQQYPMDLLPDFVERVATVAQPDDTLLVMCRSGGRSAIAVNLLAQAGFRNVYNIVDGMEGDTVDDLTSVFHGQRVKNGWKNSGAPWTYKPSPERMVLTTQADVRPPAASDPTRSQAMNTWKRWKGAVGCALGALIGAAGASAAAQTPAVDPAAVQKLKAMTEFLDRQPRFSVRTQSTIEDMHASGHRVDFDVAADVTIARPNKMRAMRAGDVMDQRFFYDGKTMTLYNPAQKVYATEAAPPTVETTIDFARETIGILLPAADLLYRNAFPLLMQDVTLATVVGQSVIGGVTCDHLLFSRPGVDFQVWIAARPEAVALQVHGHRDRHAGAAEHHDAAERLERVARRRRRAVQVRAAQGHGEDPLPGGRACPRGHRQVAHGGKP